MYIVLKYNEDTKEWETVLETYNEREAVVTHRRLKKQGYNVIID